MDLSDHIPARRLYAWYRFCPNWQVVAFLRAMLGVFEGGIATGAVFCWALGIYPTNFIGDQVMFYSVRTVGSAFAGLLASGMAQTSSVGGMLGWRWIFIVSA
jgi:hypothetical protein